jgi:hypothetical protein
MRIIREIMKIIRESIGMPFVFFGYFLLGFGIIIAFGFRTFKELSNKIYKTFI